MVTAKNNACLPNVEESSDFGGGVHSRQQKAKTENKAAHEGCHAGTEVVHDVHTVTTKIPTMG